MPRLPGIRSLATAFISPSTRYRRQRPFWQLLLMVCAALWIQTASAITGTLDWDDGSGNVSTSQPNTLGGDYIYQINPETAAHGVWRTRLTVTSGEASLYLVKGDPTVPSGSPSLSSATPGNDAILLEQAKFAEGEAWYIRVNAAPGATWSLTSGDIPVTDWGSVDDSTDSSAVTVGPEGMVWFRMQVNAGSVEAIGVALSAMTNAQGAALAAPLDMYAARTRAPLSSAEALYDQKEENLDQMLVYTEAPDAAYYLAVKGNEGDAVTVTSFKHAILTPPASFNFSLTSQSNSNSFRFVTYRVTVPASGLGWQVKMTPATDKLVDVSVRYGKVATPNDNDAYSEYAGQIIDNIVVVPPDLHDGTSYITVYSKTDSDFSFALSSGDPDVTPISFINDPSATADGKASLATLKNVGYENLGGWRYFRVDDIAYQLGFMGWELLFDTAVAKTELAIRRNAVPSFGKYRKKSASTSRPDLFDLSTNGKVLQDPTHEADVWYVGIYNPEAALGDFELTTRASAQQALAFNNGSAAVTVPTNELALMRFFKVVVPADALGWEVRLNATAGDPKMVIRRDSLPEALGKNDAASKENQWASGDHWAVAGDYSDDSEDASGNKLSGKTFVAGMGAPLQPGIYYIGVGTVATTGTLAYTITSKGIGTGKDSNDQDWAIQVQSLAFDGSQSVSLNPGELAIYRVDVPINQPGWALALERTNPTSTHEAVLAVRKGAIPNVDAKDTITADSTTDFAGTRRNKSGNEYYYQFASRNTATDTDEEFLEAGSYYVVVEGEGDNPAKADNWGTGAVNFTLRSAAMTFTDATATTLQDGGTFSWANQSLEYGEMKLYRVRVPSADSERLVAMEIQLQQQTGKPVLLVEKATTGSYRFPKENTDTELAYSTSSHTGYTRDFYHPSLVAIADPLDDYWILVGNLNQTDPGTKATYTLEVKGTGTPTLLFNGGSATVSSQIPNTFRWFRVDVPATALGWDIRLENVAAYTDPQMIICRDKQPNKFDLTGNCTANASMSAASWASGAQLVVAKDYSDDNMPDPTDLTNPIDILDTTGRYFTAGLNAPLSAGTYYIGISNPVAEANPLGAPQLGYTIRSRGIGAGVDAQGTAWAIPVQTLAFDGGTSAELLDAFDFAVYQVDVPANTRSWELKLTRNLPSSEGMLAVGYGTLPNTAATAGGISTTNSTGALREKIGDEFYYKFPTTADGFIQAGSYYVVAVSEGNNPGAHDQVGNGTASLTLTSTGALPYKTTAYNNEGGVGWNDENIEYGQVKLYRVQIAPGTTEPFCGGTSGPTDNDVIFPTMAGLVRTNTTTGARSYGADGAFAYNKNIEGGIAGSFQHPEVGAVITEPSGDYWFTVGQDVTDIDNIENYVGQSTWYDIELGCVPIPEVEFNGGAAVPIEGLAAGAWDWVWIEVPANAKGWDLRLINVADTGTPTMVIRRGLKPVNTGGNINANSTSWPAGAQWGVGAELNGDTDADNTAPSGRFFTASMGAPLEPGIYYIGVKNVHTTEGTTYTLYSRGIGEVGAVDRHSHPWLLPIRDLDFDDGSHSNTIGGSYPVYSITGADNGNIIVGPRDIALYRINNVPTNISVWEMQLTPNAGHEAMLAVRRGLPPVNGGGSPTATGPSCQAETKPTGAVREQLFGEYYYQYGCRDTALNLDNQFIQGGTYYTMVIGEGQNPATANTLGTGTTTYTLTSAGQKNLLSKPADNTVPVGTSLDWTNQQAKHGQQNLYGVHVGPAGEDGPVALEVKLRNTSGKPAVMLERASSGVLRLPTDSSGEMAYDTAADGGYARDFYNQVVIIVPEAQDADYWISVGAQQDSSASPPQANYDLRVSRLDAAKLAFDRDAPQVPAGTARSATVPAADALLKDQIRYYRVEVPETVDGGPVLGWKVTTDVTSGAVSMRFNKGALPPASGDALVTSNHHQGVLAVPFLTPGTWYVEVKATTDNTAYTIYSLPTRAERTWMMPTTAAEFTHPGLSAPNFGDSGVDNAGNAILNSGDGSQATDLKAGAVHFYKLVVPANNAGLLRTQLLSLGGNAQLYIRRDAPATLDHKSDGVTTGTALYDRADENSTVNGTSDSSYGHWVALDARLSPRLEAGTWWLAVYAEDKTGAPDLHARYRLIVSAGAVENSNGALADTTGYMQTLSPSGTTTLSGQTLLKGGVRYYRLKLPQSSLTEASSTPLSWTVTLSGTSYSKLGVRIRDTAPAGMRGKVPADIAADADWQDWKDENELTAANSHPYLKGVSTSCAAPCRHEPSGVYTFNLPPLKPGTTYYLAVRANNANGDTDITTANAFTLTSTVSASKLHLDGVLDFFTGTVNTTIPSGGSRLYRVSVPPLAGLWAHSATHDTAIRVYVQQGTVSPAAAGGASTKLYNDWSSVSGFGNSSSGAGFKTVPANNNNTNGTANSSMSVSFYNSGQVGTQVPWLLGQAYYILVKNTAASGNPLPFSLTMAGKYLSEADVDIDGLPDSWEVTHFGDVSKAASADTDGDGLKNSQEYALGADPNDADSDDDGVSDSVDGVPLDSSETVDSDGDRQGNNADTDDDGDGVPDTTDNCPLLANNSQADANEDGIGNACQTAMISFEAGVPPGWTAGAPGWQVTTTDASLGAQSLRAAVITASQTASISWRESFAGGNLLFSLKTSSQLSKDFFKLSIDGVNVTAAQKSGAFGWTDLTVTVPPGIHTLVWSYSKDASIDTGSDTVWLDNIRYIQGEDAGDADGDGTMDIDDTDDDNDGVADTTDQLPKNPLETVDIDGDGIGNNSDTDDDGDGAPDTTDPLPLQTDTWALSNGTLAKQGLGKSAAYIGDVNGDGYGDVAMGSSLESPVVAGVARSKAGMLRVMSGRNGALISALSIPGALAGDAFGSAAAGIGDVNGDDVPDIAVGAPLADRNVGGVITKDAGSVTVISGATGTRLYTVFGQIAGDRLGAAVAGVGDVNGDSTLDVLASALLADRNLAGVITRDTGAIRLYSGDDGALIGSRYGNSAKENYGAALAGAGDVNNDGLDDVIVGAPLADVSAEVNDVTVLLKDAGKVELLSGATLNVGDTDTPLLTLDGERAGDNFGAAVAGEGDLDNNGADDILVGAPKADLVSGIAVTAKDAGKVYAFDTDGNALFDALPGSKAGDYFGAAVGILRDLDGDNHDDFAIGAPKIDRVNVVNGASVTLKDAGRVSIHAGNDGSELHAQVGGVTGDLFGSVISTSGDVSGDNVDDIVTSAPKGDLKTVVSGKTVTLKDVGRVEIISGAAAGD